MSPFFAAVLAATYLVALPAFFWWLGTWKPTHARRMLAQGALLVDVGAPEEYAREHLDGARNVPADEVALRQEELGDHRQRIVIYGRTHVTSAVAAQTLRGIGFHDVFDMGTIDSARTAELHG